MTPLISVLMPVYNAMPYLPTSVDSILRQTHKQLQFVILDDGSTDGSTSYLKSLRDNRVKVIFGAENRGYTFRLQKGIQEADGEYLARQDADDISCPHRLERELAAYIDDPQLAAVFCACDNIDETGAVTGREFLPTGSKAIRESLFHSNPLRHPSVLMRREALQAVGGYKAEWEPAEDYELWLRLSESFPIDAVPEVLYQFRVYNTSVTGRRRVEQRRKANQAKTEAFARCRAGELSARTVALYHYTVALHELSESQATQATHDLREAVNADRSLEGATDAMLALAVNLAAELGPSGRALIRTEDDVQAGLAFLNSLGATLPPGRLLRLQAELLPEFHAACAYLYHKQGMQARVASHLLRSWALGSRHRRNLGLVKLLIPGYK
jgi:glycosyltransferase involved in cell wall biosynthesis